MTLSACRPGAVAVLAVLWTATAAAAPEKVPTATRVATPVPTSRPARLSAAVPDQPFVGTPAAGEKAYERILRMREAGASNESLLARVRREKVVYPLNTYDIQKLRAAGVSPAVIEAMLKSGRAGTTPVPGLPTGTTRTPSAPAATPVPAPR